MTHSAQITYSAALAAAAAAPVQQAADWLTTHGTVTIPTGARSSMTIRNCSERLATFAETVRKQWALFGGGPKPAELARPARRPAPAWPASIVKVWLSQLEDDDHAGAVLTADQLGAVYFFGAGSAPAYALAAPLQVDGLPDGLHSARRDDGRWTVTDLQTGLAVGARGYGSRAAAEAAALQEWERIGAEKAAAVLAAARQRAEPVDPAAARAAWCQHHRIEDPAAPVAEPLQAAEPAPVDDAAPMSDCMAEIVAAAPAANLAQVAELPQAADPAPDLAADAERAHLAAACLARFGVPDLAACAHLASFPVWHADTLAAYRAAKPAPVAELVPAAAVNRARADDVAQQLRAEITPPQLAELDLVELHPDTVRAWPADELARLLAEMEDINLHSEVSALHAMRHGTAADAAEGLAIVAEQARAGYLTPALAARRAALMARIAPRADEVPRDLDTDKGPRDLAPAGVLQITLTRAEGLVSECGQPVTVASFAQADAVLRDWSESAPKTGGYDKCDFLITWPDGDTYAGRYDLQHHSAERPSLGDHMVGLCDWYAGRAAPEHMTQDDYRARIAEESHDDARAAYADIEQRLRAAGAWRDILRPVAMDLRAMLQAGKLQPAALLGAGVRYTGGHGPGACELDGCGAITAAELTQWGASLAVTLEDGRELISDGADFADSGRRPARFRIDWKRHGAPYLAQLAGAVAARNASQAAAETLRDQARQDERARLLAEYPHLQRPGDGRSNVATAAANIRAMLRQAFPGVKFSVRSSSYSGGNSITAEWTDGPTDAQVCEIVDRFRHGRFDGMDDSYNFSRDQWPELFGGTYYTFTQRRLSDAAVAAILEAEWPDAADRPTVQDYRTGSRRTHDHAHRCRVHLAQNERSFIPCNA